MPESNLPFPKVRLNAFRPVGESFDDLSNAIRGYLNFYSRIEKVIAPYNAKNSQSHLPYIAPTRQYLIDIIGQRNIPKNLDEIIVNSMLNSAIRFCDYHKGKKQLPSPHHSTHHSLQFSNNNFLIQEFDVDEWKSMTKTDFRISNVYKININGFKPIYVENFRPDQFKYLIVRQRMSKTGVPSVVNWEALLFKNNLQYVIDWIDADINTRYVGII